MTDGLIASNLAISCRLTPTDLAVTPGSKVALIGPNGGGKTSLLRAIAGVEEASGEARLNGVDLRLAGPRRAHLVGYMAASRDLAWRIPVRDVIALGNGVIDRAAVERWIERFELAPLADRPSDRLSTGERARLLMARVLAGSRALLLLDEPLSNLDPYWVLRFLDEIDQAAAGGATVICALHDLSVVDRFDRVLMLAGGRVVADGAPDKIVGAAAFVDVFRVTAGTGGWRLRPADPRSLP